MFEYCTCKKLMFLKSVSYFPECAILTVVYTAAARLFVVAAHLQSLRSDDPLSKGQPSSIEQELET